MKKEKYYSPTERELLQGIVNEQEVFVVSKDGDIVTNLKFNNGLINDLVSFGYLNHYEYIDENRIIYSINSDYYRIKYLDQEDIESLGFEYSSNYADLPELGFLKDTNYLSPYTQYLLYYNTINQQLRIERIVNCGTGKEDYLFNGKIKNKSELKKLMRMLEI